MNTNSQNMGSPRSKQAVKAANVAAKNRREKIKARNKNIVIAFNYLSGNYQTKKEMLAAVKFLSGQCNGNPNLSGDTVLRKLADAVGIGRSGISKVISKSKT